MLLSPLGYIIKLEHHRKIKFYKQLKISKFHI